MSLSLRVLFWSLAGILGLFITLLLLLMLVDPNAYRSQLERRASAAFGRQVQFEGPIEIEPSLQPRVVIGGFKISNPDWASRSDLAEVEQVAVRANLLSLLRGDLEVISVAFRGVDLLMEEGKDGVNNFTFGKPGEAAVVPDIERFSIEGARIAYARSGEQAHGVNLANIEVVNLPGEPVRITADGKAQGADVALTLSAEPGEGEALDLNTLLQRARLHFKVQAPEDGFSYTDYLVGLKARIELSEFDGEAQPGGPLTLSARATLNGAPIHMRVAVDPLTVLARRPQGPWDMDMEVRGSVTRFTAKGRVARPLEWRGFDVAYGLKGEDIQALLPLFDLVLPLYGTYEIRGHILDREQRTEFDFQAKTEKTEITGDLVVHYDREPPRLDANLASERLYIPELLPVGTGTTGAEGRKRFFPDYTIPLQQIRELDSEWHVEAKHVYTDGGELGDMDFTIAVRDGRLVLDGFTAAGTDGSRIAGSGEIDASRDPAFTRLHYTVERLNYGQLLAQARVTELVKGHVDATLELSGSGNTRREFLSSASGRVTLVGGPGEFGSRDLDLWAASLVRTMLSEEWKSRDVTKLNCVVARIDVQDGVARTDSILIDTERITIAGSGTLDLDNEELNLLLKPNPKDATLVSLASPAHISGPLASPKAERKKLPAGRLALSGVLAGLVNPAFLILAFSHAGGDKNPCAAAVENVSAMAPEE